MGQPDIVNALRYTPGLTMAQISKKAGISIASVSKNMQGMNKAKELTSVRVSVNGHWENRFSLSQDYFN